MKKIIFLLVFSLALCLSACGDKSVSSDEMLGIMKEKANINAEMTECGSVSADNMTALIGMTGDNDKNYHYYAAEFSENKDGKYRFKKNIKLNNIGWQEFISKWNNGYIIVCNNENVSTVQAVITQKGAEEQTKNISVEQLPFVYYLDMSDAESDYDIKYIFLDSNGNEIE